MERYYVYLSGDAWERLPTIDELPNVRAANPLAAVAAVLRDNRFSQLPGIKWAHVVLAAHENGVPSKVERFPITPSEGT